MADEKNIQQQIREIEFFKDHSFDWVIKTGSTNDDLKAAIDSGKVNRILVADYQENGRGQFARKWESEPCDSLMFSFSSADDEVDSFPISLLLGISVARALLSVKTGLDIWLKWPNDIYLGEEKLGGILVERQSVGVKSTYVAGVGINLVKPAFMSGATSLHEAGVCINRSELLLRIFCEFSKFCKFSAPALQIEWRRLAGKFWQRSFKYSVHCEEEFLVVQPTDLAIDGALIAKSGDELLQIRSGHLVLVKS